MTDDNAVLIQMLEKLGSIDTKIGDLEKHHAGLAPVVEELIRRTTKNEADVENMRDSHVEFRTEVKDRLHTLGNYITTLKVEKKTAWFMICIVAICASALFSGLMWLVGLLVK